jgi:RNA 2',3'-cyclic 3'-phosphodiesterase
MDASVDAIHRLFFALWPDEDVRRAIAARAADVAAACAPGGRPSAPGRYHLTLQFLGTFKPLPSALVDRAIAAADSVRAQAFSLMLDRVGSFERNRVWWLGPGAAPPGLQSLHERLGAALAATGLPPDEDATRFVPHVTLGRKLQQRFEPRATKPLAWVVRDFVLVDSAAGEPDYRILRRWPLDPVSRGS